MKILVVGHQGYVGAPLVRHLRRVWPDAELVGFDTGYFALGLTHAQVPPERALDMQFHGDVRELDASRLAGVDAVVALAAISNDPMGAAFEAVTGAINRDAILRLARLAAAGHVKRFVFASSCSVYGLAEGAARREGDPLHPQTAYARSKIETEQALADSDFEAMTTTCLRFATACGMSERLRLDLVLNDFVASALAVGRIAVLSDGTPWRPLIDVEDMARAVEWAITRSPENGGRFLRVNVGADDWNYQVRDLAAAVARALPDAVVEINRAAPPDTRSYKVDFGLYARLAPAHRPRMTLQGSIARLVEGLRGMGFADSGFRQSEFMRLRMLEAHRAAGRLDGDLRWTPAAFA